MVNKVSINEGQPIRQGQPGRAVSGTRAAEPFEAVIRREIEKLGGLKFSNHALQRLDARNIKLSPTDHERIAEAVSRAQAKGARDSLILMRGAAFVVSVKNQTVVTVLDREETRDTVFTNIDSAVVMDGV
ncbi:MAG: TIGR02530 family flagellar biosynthesis protein [Candidatus Abyssubacteria bacterium]